MTPGEPNPNVLWNVSEGWREGVRDPWRRWLVFRTSNGILYTGRALLLDSDILLVGELLRRKVSSHRRAPGNLTFLQRLTGRLLIPSPNSQSGWMERKLLWGWIKTMLKLPTHFALVPGRGSTAGCFSFWTDDSQAFHKARLSQLGSFHRSRARNGRNCFFQFRFRHFQIQFLRDFAYRP